MVLDLNIIKDDDGFNAEVPSIKGCECWANNEDEAIVKAVELVKYYLKLPDSNKVNVDIARRIDNKKIFKLIFDK
ncbi:MAG: hypothetical protein KF816_06785 [Melioribacteraceae bacterium]|jgi:predicted RNase H-like HicB family nuclease|nr:hypothetical protein [Melioribacteraceae bacterium]